MCRDNLNSQQNCRKLGGKGTCLGVNAEDQKGDSIILKTDPAVEEWIQFLKLPGKLGGLAATELDWNTQLVEHCDS